ncbi:flagellar basal body P-ring biosynthesis protein FlgA [Salinisphaera sp. S4-8]|uniref:flagellar basal body P-ring formation chaperone FlgA n=1 Tax=Salinisphaera sp. S4-8 TaxID=633357 RepID=UPI00333E4F56
MNPVALVRTARIAPQLLAAVVLVCVAIAAQADDADMQQLIGDYLRAQAPGTGDVEISVAMPSVSMPVCHHPRPFLPSRNPRIAGNITVGVQCPGDRPATRYFQARVTVISDYYVAARDLSPGDVLGAADIRREQGDLSRLPPNVATRPDSLIGMSVSRRVAAGRPLGGAMVREPIAIKRGEQVRVVAVGPGFSITTEGKALNAAPLGGDVRVSTREGSIVIGRSTNENTVTITR